jgi:hypothetical protein
MRPRVVIAICMLPLVITGCVHALHGYNPPSRQSLQVQARAPERYTVRVDEAQSYPVPSDGLVSFDVPSLSRGCAVYLFGLVKIADHRSEDVAAIEVISDGRVVRQLSLSQISKLPTNSESAHVLTLK